jgi:hypothetical protein
MLATWPIRAHAAARLSDVVPRRLAGGAAAPAVIHSVYRSVFNITTRDGLLSIASPPTGGLPNGVLVDLGPDFRTLGLWPGMAVVATDGGIGVPSAELEIDLSAATRWSPRLVSPHGGTSLAASRWRRRRRKVWAISRHSGALGGFGALLRGDPGSANDLGITGQAGTILDDLKAALLAGDRRAAGLAARRLIGLGPGLTPSGDDVLVGMESALHALGRPMAGFLGGAIHDVDDRTTAIAASLIQHAAAGEFAERIHRLLAALLSESDEGFPVAIERAVAWGATSGTDCLLGVLLGLDIASGTTRRSG